MYLRKEAWLAKVSSWEEGLLLVIMATVRGALVLEIRAWMLQLVQSQGQDQRAAGASQIHRGSWQPG